MSRFRRIAVLSLMQAFIPYICGAQQIAITPREQIIFSTLNAVQAREDAMGQSIMEAQLRSLEGPAAKKQRLAPVRANAAPAAPAGKGVSGTLNDLMRQAHPYVLTETIFDSNVDQKHSPKSGVTKTLTPGFKVNYFTPNSSTNVDVNIENHYDVRRHLNDLQTLTMSGVDSMLVGRYSLSLADEVSTNRVSTQFMGVADKAFQRSWINTFNGGLSRSFHRLGLDFLYTRKDTVYGELMNDADLAEETWTFGTQYRIATKTRLNVDYTHGRSKLYHAHEASKNTDDINLTLAGVFSSKVSGLLRFDQLLTDSKLADDSRNTSYGTQIAYRMNERSNISLDYTYAIIGDQLPALETNESLFKLSTNRRLAINPKINVSYSFTKDLTTYPKTTFYKHKKNVTGHSLGLTYAFRRWLDLSLDYAFSKNAFNYQESYIDHAVTFKTEARF